ncbi:MAG TPA: hypothetical protein PKX01_15260 [Rhodocyclaceae bacterium]|nr:hypothetical protein [Rhodocyclaceae bacterium]HMZ77542.1 hypothetical protein [Rhodocyclaceae bacterium]HNE16447.1 hypothetical protein [Rhodocyclaceae bacterium]HNF60527.1 hypothetical protein [Rhodocyclaceae bacterium]HNI83269.1 hypothetical protein [Rhodocyclaceae bacterium]
MTQRDIELALQLVREALPHLAVPRRLCTRRLKPGSRAMGQYRWLSDTLRLNPRYLARLSDPDALDLLDTILHELLHKASPLWKQVRDTFRPHPDIWLDAERLTAQLGPRFLHLRRADARRHRTA